VMKADGVGRDERYDDGSKLKMRDEEGVNV
jgi:hypothetical protein